MIRRDGGEGDLAPVIPLFGGAAPAAPVERASSWNDTWAESARTAPTTVEDSDGDAPDPADAAAAAEAALLRKLRTRSLSVREARAVLIERDVADADADEIIERFTNVGYLDDAKLAEQLIHSGVERKGQGRMMLAQSLGKRGIPREVIDQALAERPDDDEERALAFARTKVRSLASLDRETALRRLTGQLARRGYGGSAATKAARMALDESSTGRSSVRFS